MLIARASRLRTFWAGATLIAAGAASWGSLASAAGGDRLHVNGVALATRVLTVRGAPDDIAARLLTRWRSDPSVQWVHAQTLGSRLIVGRRQGPVSVSATVTAAPKPGYSRVVVSVTDARAPLRQPPSLAALRPPAGVQWVSVSESQPDPAPRGQRAAQPALRAVEYFGVMDASPEQSRLRWIASLRRAGFVLQPQAAQQLEAYRDGETLWVGFQALGSRTGVVVQRRGSVADPQ